MPKKSDNITRNLIELIGIQITKKRAEKKMSQGELSKKSGLSRTYISQLENNNLDSIDLFKLDKICNALDTSLVSVLTMAHCEAELKELAITENNEKFEVIKRLKSSVIDLIDLEDKEMQKIAASTLDLAG